MTIDEKVAETVSYMVEEFGRGHVATTAEIKSIVGNRHQVNETSVIPSDYCYNRVNNGISMGKPALFEHLGTGRYKCLGSDYPYNGPIYHRPRGASGETIAGQCVMGVRHLAEDR